MIKDNKYKLPFSFAFQKLLFYYVVKHMGEDLLMLCLHRASAEGSEEEEELIHQLKKVGNP